MPVTVTSIWLKAASAVRESRQSAAVTFDLQ